MKKSLIKQSIIWILLSALLIAIFFAGLFIGRYSISPQEVIKVLWGVITGEKSESMNQAIIINIRLPRAILTILIEAGLSAAGAAFQGMFQNPLVSPDVLGISAGSAFGAVLGIMICGGGNTAMILSAVFGIITVFITYLLLKINGESTVLSLVLAGMVMSAFMNALISMMKYMADPYEKLPAITYWLMGSFSKASYSDIKLIIIPMILSLLVLFLLRWRINILSLGDEEAFSLGVNPKKIRLLIILSATVITASSVMCAGIIGWVGLIIPHIARMIFGVDHKRLIPSSMLIGAIFLTVVDIIARNISSVEIPIGILTAVVGAPFFILFFKKTGGNK